jgi:glycosyltransferase involved in cell wall biosynthesis
MNDGKTDCAILILSSGSPATNPRMVKEATELIARGYSVHVLYGFIVPWANDIDENILQAAAWTAERVGGSPNEDILLYNFLRLMEFLSSKFQRRTIFRFSLSRLSLPLLVGARKFRPRAIIAHNLGALPAAYLTAKKSGIPLFFDAEDFHSGESTDSTVNRINRQAELNFFPYCRAISAASPLIAQEYSKLFPDLQINVVHNCFLRKDQKELIQLQTNQLNLVWFSQTIGDDRGLEEILGAIEYTRSTIPIHFKVIGACSTKYKAKLINMARNSDHLEFEILSPMTEQEIMSILRYSHIGLATELGDCHNRDICLSNKIFSYLLNGCQIIFSDTTAHKKFLKEYPRTGRIVTLHDAQSIRRELTWFLDNLDSINELRKSNWELAHAELNYESDSKAWLDLVTCALK